MTTVLPVAASAKGDPDRRRVPRQHGTGGDGDRRRAVAAFVPDAIERPDCEEPPAAECQRIDQTAERGGKRGGRARGDVELGHALSRRASGRAEIAADEDGAGARDKRAHVAVGARIPGVERERQGGGGQRGAGQPRARRTDHIGEPAADVHRAGGCDHQRFDQAVDGGSRPELAVGRGAHDREVGARGSVHGREEAADDQGAAVVGEGAHRRGRAGGRAGDGVVPRLRCAGRGIQQAHEVTGRAVQPGEVAADEESHAGHELERAHRPALDGGRERRIQVAVGQQMRETNARLQRATDHRVDEVAAHIPAAGAVRLDRQDIAVELGRRSGQARSWRPPPARRRRRCLRARRRGSCRRCRARSRAAR